MSRFDQCDAKIAMTIPGITGSFFLAVAEFYRWHTAYYLWRKRPATIISANELHLYRRTKALFKASRNSLGSRELIKKLREEGFQVGRYRTKTLMRKLNLKVQQRVAYKVTTKRKHSDQVADNLLNQNFNTVGPNEIWAGDITYLRTNEGWMYLAIVMELYSRRIVGWHIDKRMTTDLIGKALMKAVNLRLPKLGLVFHSDRGSHDSTGDYWCPLGFVLLWGMLKPVAIMRFC